MYKNKTIAAIIPALNEEASVGVVVAELLALSAAGNRPLIDHIVVCDNTSIDATPERARAAGASVVYEAERGYGAACLAAIASLNHPDIVLFIDADNSSLASEALLLLDPIINGADLVIGSRVSGLQEHGALTPQQRFGNLLASFTIRKLWHHPITDLGPYRAISYNALQALMMQDRAFGWTVEMQVKAIQAGMDIVEVPVSSVRRIGKSKISGTLAGTIGAMAGIFGTIIKLWRQEKAALRSMSS